MGARYAQSSLEERRKIERWRHARVSVTEMARVLKRHRSTIFRELKRNHFFDPELPKVVGNFGVAAHFMTRDQAVSNIFKLCWKSGTFVTVF